MVLRAIFEAVGLVLGSLAAAALFSWACWNAFKLFRHPELGTPTGIALALLGCGHLFVTSQFLRLALVYAAALAIGLWPVGLAWRRLLNDHHIQGDR